MDFNRSLAEEAQLKAQRRERFSNPEGERRYGELVAARARRRQQLAESTQAGARLIGTCTLMCPEFEREERELKNNLAPQELVPGTRTADAHKTVKTFHRSAAGNEEPLPEDLRTPDTLVRTVSYLIDQVIGKDPSMKSCHGFVRDRTRSVRQDFTIQNIRDARTVLACEQIARFHIASLHVLCGHPGFEEQQDMEQLRNTLKTLIELYADMRKHKGKGCANEAEFAAYYVVAHLRDQDAKRVAERLPRDVFCAPVVQLALRLHMLGDSSDATAVRMDPGNRFAAQNLATQFFRTLAAPHTPFLLACLAEYHFPAVRRAALRALAMAFPLQTGKLYPAATLASMLAFDSVDQMTRFCALFGITVDQDGGGGGGGVRLGERRDKKLVFSEPAQKVARGAPNACVVGVKLRSSLVHVLKATLDPAMLAPAPLIPVARPSLPAFDKAAPSFGAASARASSQASAFAPPAAPSTLVKAASQPAALAINSSALQQQQQQQQQKQLQQPALFSAFNTGPRKPAKSVSFAPSAQTTPTAATPMATAEAKPVPPMPVFTPPAVPLQAAAASAAPPPGSLFSFTAQPTVVSEPKPAPQPETTPAPAPAVPTMPPSKPSTQPAPAPAPKEAPADVVWNQPRPRINFTSLTNTLYDALLRPLVNEVIQPQLQASQQRARVALGLSDDIARALVDYTAGFMAYETAYRTLTEAQADTFRRSRLLRGVLARWGMDAVARQQDRALMLQHADELKRLADQQYVGAHHVFASPTRTPRRPAAAATGEPHAAETPPSTLQLYTPPRAPALPRDFWQSQHLGRACLDHLVRMGMQGFSVTVGLAGVTGDVLASWLWWQVDPHAAHMTPRAAVYAGTGRQTLAVREAALDGDGSLTALVVLLASAPLTPADVPADFMTSALGVRMQTLVAAAVGRVARQPSTAEPTPLLFLFWDAASRGDNGGAGSPVARRVRRLVERTLQTLDARHLAAVHTVALHVHSARGQLAEGLRWVCRRMSRAHAARVVPAGEALGALASEMMQSLARLRGPLAAPRIGHLGGAACAVFNCAVDTVNAYMAAAAAAASNLVVNSKSWVEFPPARPDTLGTGYFALLPCVDRSPAVRAAVAGVLLPAEHVSLASCIRALELLAKLQLDEAAHTVGTHAGRGEAEGTFVDRLVLAEVTKGAERTAEKCFAAAVRLAADWRAAERVSLGAGKRPADTLGSLDDAMSVVSAESPAPSYMSVSTAPKRQRPELPSTRLQLALDRARRQLEQPR